MRTRSVIAVVAAAATTLTLGACTSASQGGSAGPASDAAATAGFDPSTVARDDTIAALVPEAVAADGKLTVGSDLTYAPAEFVAADGKTPTGYDVDLAIALANLMGLTPDIQSSTFDAIIPSIGTKYEVGISSFTVTAERLEAVDMVTYIDAGSQFAVQKGNPDGVDLDNLCGLTIGVQTGTTQQDELNELQASCGDDKMTLLTYNKQADVTTNLVGGKVQAMYADSPVAAYAVGQTDGKLETLGDIRGAAPEAVVVPKGDTAMDEAVRAALQKLMDDGTLVKILDAWGNAQGALTKAEINPQVG